MTTTVVHLVGNELFDVYIGRPISTAKRHALREQNHFAPDARMRRAASPALAAAEYESVWRHRLAGNRRRMWLRRLAALRGKRLGCGCRLGEHCHGLVLLRLIEEFCPQEAER